MTAIPSAVRRFSSLVLAPHRLNEFIAENSEYQAGFGHCIRPLDILCHRVSAASLRERGYGWCAGLYAMSMPEVA